ARPGGWPCRWTSATWTGTRWPSWSSPRTARPPASAGWPASTRLPGQRGRDETGVQPPGVGALRGDREVRPGEHLGHRLNRPTVGAAPGVVERLQAGTGEERDEHRPAVDEDSPERGRRFRHLLGTEVDERVPGQNARPQWRVAGVSGLGEIGDRGLTERDRRVGPSGDVDQLSH